MDNENKIQQIVQFRTNQGLTQKEFAKKIGMNSSYFCRLENGQTLISDKTLRKIAMAFGLNEEEFIEGHIEKNNVDSVPNTTFEKNCHNVLDEILTIKEGDNLAYLRDINKFLVEVQYFLNRKKQIYQNHSDPDECIEELEKEKVEFDDILMNIDIN